MEKNTGYVITAQNAQMLAVISGKDPKTLKANIGWVLVYVEMPFPEYRLMPKNVAERMAWFSYEDSPLNGLPARSQDDIRKEWKEVNDAYRDKLAELRKELDRAMLRDHEEGKK